MTAAARLAPAGPAAARLGYVLGAFPVLSETFVSGEVAEVARAGALGAVFVFDPREGAGLPAAVQGAVLPVAGLAPAAPGALGLARAARATAGLAPLRQASILRHAARIARRAVAEGCTHLHAHFGGGAALHALAAARMAGLGFSLSLHSGSFARNFDGPGAAALLMRGADAVACATPELAAAARAAGARRAEPVAAGADLRRFRPSARPGHNGRLLALGRLIDCKGFDTLLAALARMGPAARPGLDLAGEGPERPALEAAARAAGLDVRFLGARPNDWFAAEGGGYLAFVAPFRPGRDGQVDSGPVVLKEALALGLPVVTTDLPGPAAIVGAAGRVVPAADPAALAAAIAALPRSGGEERAELARRARAQAEGFGIEAQARALLSLLTGAAG